MHESYRLGDSVLVREIGVYRLPRGLRAGQQVTVRAFLPGQRLVEAEGRRYVVSMANIRAGGGGEWGEALEAVASEFDTYR